ncbi:hypothetical protein [Actinophytocola sp.]|uniref:SRPBCC family protein n=1 Tax=Actinophytocola sp. TaxID=1872138 RepID=UPI002D7F62FD|nr:hypothetical protein [Actinophytocola sp.]HET9138465.1 hypothetical protein [Actinophytocola sp.]
MTEPFRIELTIAAPADEVWQALRDPELIRRWHGWEIEDGGLDDEIDLIYRQHATETEPGRVLSLGDGTTFTLDDGGDDGGTRIRMVRGPRGGNPEWDEYYDDITEGWVTFLHQLRFAVERHAGVDRRTLFFSGAPGPAGEPRTALGLDRITAEPGQAYRTDLVGEPVTGQVWFRSTRQTGLSVDGWGDGLVIVGTAPPSAQRPHPQAMAVLTTYGLADKEFDELAERWRTWWEQTFTS